MSEKLEPIGVFDSGIGGLTVLKALRNKFPHESYVYIGDTARLPYGTKSPETIVKYSQTLTREILKHNVKAIVVACNTASTHALEAVKAIAGDIPVLGMIEPAAKAAIAATRNGHVGVLATYGTIKSGIYETTLKQLNPDMRVSSQACQMLVALAEEGWASNEISEATLRKYLEPIFNVESPPDTLILGCTHFPLFQDHLRKILGENVVLINSGEAAADTLSFREGPNGKGTTYFLATDDPTKFAISAAKFLGEALCESDVDLIDI